MIGGRRAGSVLPTALVGKHTRLMEASVHTVPVTPGVSDDSERGGFVVSPEALWTGSEMARSYRHAIDRGWSPGAVFAYWQTQVGVTGNLMIDPPQHVDSLLHIHRRVGAL